ncbi:uncharacterized protein BDV14DRAFT_130725 [Aspergillus stella-maris]|uniref:uncharacterized protein n=1 Tax=Aspergillus stella-maris TaxID=1810926 RepID=UPI003CCCD82B
MIASSHALTASFLCSSLSDSATFIHCVPGAPRADTHLQSSPEFLSPVFSDVFRVPNLVEEAPAPPPSTIQFFSCFLLKTDTWRPCRSSIPCPSILSVAHPFINFPVARFLFVWSGGCAAVRSTSKDCPRKSLYFSSCCRISPAGI